jgi:hypothetical protein
MNTLVMKKMSQAVGMPIGKMKRLSDVVSEQVFVVD